MTPGPGAYSSPSRKEGPAYHIGARTGVNKTADGPGPGAYNSKMDPIKESAPGVKMGQAPRGSAVKNDMPGPGQYNYNDGPKGGVSFGKEA